MNTDDKPTGDPPEAQGEIATDYYYAERWKGHHWEYGSWDSLEIVVPGSPLGWNRSFSGSGHHGRGSGLDDELLVGRRLWRGGEFVGAKATDEYVAGRCKEHFIDLQQFGPFLIPGKIELLKDDRREVLHVRRVEFLAQPDTNWFLTIKEKYFQHNTELWKTNLHEAGWSGEKRP